MRKFLIFSLLITSGVGAFSQNPFRTKLTGNWNNSNTWEEDTGGGFAATLNTPTSASGAITIRNTHTVTITADITIDETTVQTGGVLSIDPTIKGSDVNVTINNGTGTDLSIDGPFNLLDDAFGSGSKVSASSNSIVYVSTNGSVSINDTSLSGITFSSGSTYQHDRNGGSIPKSTWSTTSTCLITGFLSGTLLGFGTPIDPQNFGNLTWNCAAQTGNTNLGMTSSTAILGDFSILNTNGFFITINQSVATTVQVSGNMIVSGTSRFATTASAAVTLRVLGDFSYSSSSASASILGANNAGTASVLDVRKNFTYSSGLLSKTGTNGTSTIIFGGSTPQLFTGGGVAITTAISYQVNNGSTLDLGVYNLTGSVGSSFTLNAGGTLRVGSLDAGGAIQTGAAGNIQVGGTRTYTSGSTIIYNGASAQFISSGHPSSSGINTQINNGSGVTLFDNVTLGGNLTLTSGNLNIGGNTLSLNGNFTPNANSLGVNSSSNLAIGGISSFGNLAISGGPTLNDFTLNRTSSGSVTLASNLTIGGTFTQTAGDVILNGNTLTISGVYSRSGGGLIGTSSSSIVINGAGALPSPSGVGITAALGTLTMDRASATLETSSSFSVTNLNLLLGTFQNGSTVTIASSGVITRDLGGLTGAGTIAAASSYDVTYLNTSGSPISTGVELPTGTTQLRNLTISSSGQINLNAAATVNGILTFATGIFNAGSNALDLKGNLVSNNTSTLTSSSITFSGTTTISGSTQVIFGNISVTGSLTPTSALAINGNLINNGTLNSGSSTVTFGGTTAITGSSTSSFNNVVISGALTAPSSFMNVAGTWTNNGTFTNNSGTVVFNGTSTISGSATNFGGLTISGTLTSPATLNVARDFTNNGTFTSGASTLVLNGSSTQSISGSAVTTFNNISVTNTGGPPAVQIQSDQNLKGVLTLSASSQFDADGSLGTSVFKLLSSGDNPTIDASIAALPSGAQVTGNVTVQRYMAIEGASGGRIYRYISSPVSGAAVSQIQTFIPVTGTFTGASSCSGCLTGQSMFSYNEPDITGDLNTGYVNFPTSTNTETFAGGVGYSIFVRGNISPVLGAGSALYELRGAIFSGSQPLPVSFTDSGTPANDGWNLVGNPYPSTIDWDAAGWTKSVTINNAIYTRDNGSAVNASYVGGFGTNGGSRYIASGQAFYIKSVTGVTPVLTASESIKVPGTQTTFIREETVPNVLRITMKKGNINDESVIRFSNDATANFDPMWDAHKLKNAVFNLSSLTADNKKLSINTMPKLICGAVVKLDVSNAPVGSYSLNFSEFDSFENAAIKLSLSDAFTNQAIDIRKTNSYAFQITTDPSSFGSNRFSFTVGELVPSISAKDNVRCGQGSVSLTATGAKEGDYRWYESATSKNPISGITSSTFNTPEIAKTTTFYVSAANSSGCEEQRLPAMANVTIIEPVIIAVNGKYLQSSYETGNQWFLDGKAIPGATGKTIEATEAGVYKVEVSSSNCTTSGEFLVTSVEDEAHLENVTIYPNPTADILNIEVKSTNDVSTKLVNILGKALLDQQLSGGNVKKGALDLREHSAGIYILLIQDGDKVYKTRIIKK